jgi:hypothetical protein
MINRKEKEKTMPSDVNLMKSQVVYWAAGASAQYINACGIAASH